MKKIGQDIYVFCKSIFKINRSLTGNGVRETLNIIKNRLPDLIINEIPSGTKCFDWEIPKEWNVRDAYIKNIKGEKIVDFKKNNISLLGYSTPINKKISLEELLPHLFSLPKQPSAIPYITSYYKENWGFCISENDKNKLKTGEYEVFIDSSLNKGSLTYGELLIKGQINEEVFISTYICHPSLANDNLSGLALATFLSKYISEITNNYYSYRIIFIPETIGAIAYLSKNLVFLKKNVVAGFILTCVGDDNSFSFLPSRNGNTLSDKVALHVLNYSTKDFIKYSFLERGSDERQYCSPNVDLPVCSVMRSKYGEYKEYHTSLDNLDFISPSGFSGSFKIYTKIIKAIENNFIYKTNIIGEPQLGKRGMYPNISTKKSISIVKNLKNVIIYCDGKKDLIDIANIINVPVWELYPIIKQLLKNKLISKINYD
jgi:aminopeptidase-like protein